MSSHERDDERPSALASIDPPRNFTVTTEERIRALAIGVPAYAARKRRIEDTEEKLVGTLVALHDALEAKGVAPAEVARAVEQKARSFDLAKVNAVIAVHNRYYPVEANLPIDYATGEYLIRPGRKWSPEPEWTAERLLAAYDAALRARANAETPA